ncbi:ferredoxin [Rhizodiscina lignyota]|uniref:Ferredoxin n=1 Tax=Rhizodiscina lignyota TaxID=1504668 RepID=A0A9P4I7S4_9PEZI|nr:ferredoxin [Rhizodiscina lignyota]
MTIPRTASRNLLLRQKGPLQRFLRTLSTTHPPRPNPKRVDMPRPSSYSLTRRSFSAAKSASHNNWSPPKAGEELYTTFIDKGGNEHKIAVSKGDNLLDVAQANDIDIEGACQRSCACSTCHVIVDGEEMYEKMTEPDDSENDMLDLAFGLTKTSRLGCQVIIDEALDGIRVKLPSMTRNAQASDFSSQK